MNIYSILPGLCGLIVLGLGIFVLRKNPKCRVNQIFFLHTITVVVWLSFYAVLYNFNTSLPWVAIWFRVSYCGITFIAVTYFHYVSEFTSSIPSSWKKWNYLHYALGLWACFLILKTDRIVQGLHQFYWGPYPKAGAWHPFYLSVFIYMLTFALFLLIYELRNPRTEIKKRNQTKYILAAFFLLSFASLDFLPNYGMEFYPVGYALATIFILIIAYAIIKHQIMDITIVFRRGLVYSLLVSIITIFYSSLVLIIEKIFQEIIGYRSFIVSLIAAILIAIFFIPLRNKIQQFVDKYFFKGTREQIARENEFLRQEIIKSEKFKTISTLASGIVHEIKNPVTAIKTFNEYLPNKLEDRDFLQQYSELVDREMDRIDQLTRNLLEFAKPSPPEFKESDIHRLLNHTLNLLANQCAKNQIAVIKKFTAAEIHCKIDPGRIAQVLINILLNALDAMPQGGTLTVSTKITEHLEISIADTGHGIAPQDLTHIFEPFFSKKDGGTGLGLSITREIVEKHCGKIRVESKLGKGTTFIIEFPLG